MKRRFFAIPASLLLAAIMLTGCGKVECDNCGKVNKCEQIEILGQTVNICEECRDKISDGFDELESRLGKLGDDIGRLDDLL